MYKPLVLIALSTLSAPLLADPLTVISFGGLNKTAQEEAFYAPFQKHFSQEIRAGEYNGEMAKIKVMADTGKVSWDVVEVESAELERGCEEGLFEPLDHSLLGDPAQYVDGSLSNCGVGIFIWSTAIAYNGKSLKDAPGSWADFWDTQRFPGKRALRKSAKFTLEIALLADGVPADQLSNRLRTEAGINQAFHKLDQIKPYIQWWESGAQPMQWLAAGDVVMTSVYTARAMGARQDGYDFPVVWKDSLYDMDSWAVVKGSRNAELAKKFIAFASQPTPQQRFAEIMHNGPVNRAALSQMSASMLPDLPTAEVNLAKAHRVDTQFWLDNGEELEQRFNAWAAR